MIAWQNAIFCRFQNIGDGHQWRKSWKDRLMHTPDGGNEFLAIDRQRVALVAIEVCHMRNARHSSTAAHVLGVTPKFINCPRILRWRFFG